MNPDTYHLLYEDDRGAVVGIDGMQLLDEDVRAAIERAAGLGRAYLASQLLPVLARWQGAAARRATSHRATPLRPTPLTCLTRRPFSAFS